jgi:hypothetical protein
MYYLASFKCENFPEQVRIRFSILLTVSFVSIALELATERNNILGVTVILSRLTIDNLPHIFLKNNARAAI